MKNLEAKIFQFLSSNISPKRFEHSYCVSTLAVELAAAYGADIFKAQTAALLHDCAKGLDTNGLVKILKNKNKKIKYYSEIVKYSPQLLHAHAGAVIAKKEFGIKDADILNAIENHTLGRAGMSLLEKIIFIADSVSEDRKHKGRAAVRELAKRDIDRAFTFVLANKIKYVVDLGYWLCPQTIETWNYYAEKN
jgi:putative HD superfamily hydrolase of NAD metabolism